MDVKQTPSCVEIFQDFDGGCVVVGGADILELGVPVLSRASRKFAATPRRKPFLIAHVLRVRSHSCSMRFLVCVAVVSLILGSYVVAGSLSWTHVRPVR